jgi:hypothetical protein
MTSNKKLRICIKALKEISKAEGAYTMDRMEYAGNIIRNMSDLAKISLAKIGEKLT